MPARKRSILSMASGIAGLVLSLVLAAAIAGNLAVLVQRTLLGIPNPTVFGYAQAVVASGSMEPALQVDDLVITKAEPIYAQGDIIMFVRDDMVVTHRIAQVEPEGFVTKGDANDSADPGAPVTLDDVIGRVVLTVPHVGAAIAFASSPFGMLVLLGLGVLLVEGQRLIVKAKGGARDAA